MTSSFARSPTNDKPVGLIGLGLLGTEIAKRLLSGVQSLVGWDLAADRCTMALATGLQVTNGVAEVFSHCEVIVVCLPSDRIVREVLEQNWVHLRPGLRIIDTSTGDPQAAAQITAKLAEGGIEYIDATVSGSSVQLEAGEAVLMVGATDEAFRASLPLLRLLSDKVFHTGPPGSGATMKLVTNLVLGLNRAALAEGLAFARSLGLDLSSTLTLLRESMAYSRIMDTKGEKMIHGDFTPQAKLSQHLKDVRLMLAAATRSGLRLPLSETHRTQLERAESLGWGDFDNSALIQAWLTDRPAENPPCTP